jgi:hypothetical protein
MLTGCSNPMKDYQATVTDLQIQENLEKINEEMNELVVLYNTFYNAEIEESYETKEELLTALGYAELNNQIKELDTLVTQTISGADSIEIKDDEVVKTNQNLIKALDEYEEILNTTNKNVIFLSNITAECGFFLQSYNELYGMMLSDEQPSVLVTFQLYALLEEYQDALLFFTSEDDNYKSLIENGQMDVKKLQDIKEAFQAANEKILAIQPANDNDEKYIQTVATLIEYAINITTNLINDAQLIEEMHQEESYEIYVTNKQVTIDAYLTKWENSME